MGANRARPPPTPKEKSRGPIRKGLRNKPQGPKFWEEFVGTRPTDDVWRTAGNPSTSFSFSEILAMHREYCCPEMLNNPDGIVILEAFLDLRTKKKTKFMSTIKKTLLLPHNFDDGVDNRVVAFCKTDEDKAKAIESGAAFAGGIPLIKEMEKGDIKHYDYEYIVSTIDILPELVTIRKYLRDQFPSQKLGTLGSDITALVHHYKYGKMYESSKEEDAIGSVKLKLGKLSMTDEQLQENLDAYVEAICSHKSADLGRFVLCGRVSVPPSEEVFRVHHTALLPAAQRQTQEARELEQEEEEVIATEVDSDDEAVPLKAKR